MKPVLTLQQAQRKSLFWRLHFWAALIASPFVLVATLTGILYIFTPQIEAVLYRQLDQVTPAITTRSLDDSVAAAIAAAPAGAVLQSVLPAADTGASTQVLFAPAMAGMPGHEGHGTTTVVYVDPATAQVLGSMASGERFGSWSKKLHSRLLQNDNWRWMIELAASALTVMLVSGIYLWWPRGVRKGLPQADARGRTRWQQWHGFVGVALAAMSIVILSTGLTWSKYAGGQIRSLRDLTGQASQPVPKHLQSTAGIAPLGWQAALDAARLHAPAIALQLTPPRGASGTWNVTSVDRSQPLRRVDLILDAGTGALLYQAGWDQQTAFGKATALGIPFHRGEFGWWNQALLLAFGLSVLFSLGSGWVMFFKRRRAGSFGLPRVLPGAWRAVPVGAWLGAAVLCIGLPLLAISAAVLLVLEAILALAKPVPALPIP